MRTNCVSLFQTPNSLKLGRQFEIDYGGSTDITEINKHYKLEIIFFSGELLKHL